MIIPSNDQITIALLITITLDYFPYNKILGWRPSPSCWQKENKTFLQVIVYIYLTIFVINETICAVINLL